MSDMEDIDRPWQHFLVSCVLCGRSEAEQRVAELTSKGGLRLRLCEGCTDRWRGYGLVVTTVEGEPDGAGRRAPLGNSDSPSTAAATYEAALTGEVAG